MNTLKNKKNFHFLISFRIEKNYYKMLKNKVISEGGTMSELIRNIIQFYILNHKQ